MTFKLKAFITLLCFLVSCKSDQSSNSIILKVILTKNKTKDLVNRYIYLVDISKQTVVDSTLVKGDTVIFREHWTPGFVPYMVSVQKFDTSNGYANLSPMGIQSPYVAKSINTTFYLDTGVTILKPFIFGYNNTESDFMGSKQNEPFFKRVLLQYPGEDSVNRHGIIGKNISKIKAYPYSIHLLEQLFYYKERFLNEDLKNQLFFFSDNIKKTPLFKSFTEYFATSSTFDRAFPEIEFENQNGENQKIARDSAAYYLIVYWASWCVPCRREIPELKRMYNQFSKNGLIVTSISLDGSKRNWQTALQQEKMPWQQLIAIDSTKAFIDLHYNIKAIPKAYLFNRKKELIKVFEDALVMTKSIDQLFENAK